MLRRRTDSGAGTSFGTTGGAYTPLFAAKHIRVSGNGAVPSQRIRQLAGINDQTNVAHLDEAGLLLVALDLLISLATGQRWLGREVKRRVRCAYISREDSPLLTKARIKGFMNGQASV